MARSAGASSILESRVQRAESNDVRQWRTCSFCRGLSSPLARGVVRSTGGPSILESKAQRAESNDVRQWRTCSFCRGLSSPPSGPAKSLDFVGDCVEGCPPGRGGLSVDCHAALAMTRVKNALSSPLESRGSGPISPCGAIDTGLRRYDD